MTSTPWLSCAAGAILWIGSLAAARSAPVLQRTGKPEPKLVVGQTIYDAGKLSNAKVVRADFPLRNGGRAPLTILDVKKDCGCTVPSCDKTIPPGGMGHLRVTMRVADLHGPIEKHVYLESDDPKQASVTFTIRADLPHAIEVRPGSEVVIPFTRGKPATVQVTLHVTDGSPLEIGALECTVPYVTAEVAPGSARGGLEVKLQVSVAADAPSDLFETVLTVETGHIRVPRLGIRLFGQPAAAVTVRPPRVGFGRVSPESKGPIQRVLTLSRTSGSFHVLKAEDSLGCLHFQPVPTADGSSWEIKVTYTGGWKEEQTKGMLRVTTDDPARPVIEIPYSADVW